MCSWDVDDFLVVSCCTWCEAVGAIRPSFSAPIAANSEMWSQLQMKILAYARAGEPTTNNSFQLLESDND